MERLHDSNMPSVVVKGIDFTNRRLSLQISQYHLFVWASFFHPIGKIYEKKITACLRPANAIGSI